MNWWSGKSVLITGINGFIGSKLRFVLESLGTVTSGMYEYKGSIVPSMPPPVDVVFHLAAKTVVSDDPTMMISNNFNITNDVLKWATLNKSKSIIIVSSDRVYGDEKRIVNPYTENDPLLARDIYGTSKILSDILTESYIKRNLPVGIARLSNVYGPGDNHLNRIIPSILKSLMIGEPPVLNNSYPERDYIYIDDAIDGLLRVAEYIYGGENKYSIFNLSSGSSIRNDDLLYKIIKISGKNVNPVISSKDESGKISQQKADPSRAMLVLNWERKFNLDDGLEKTLKWWRGW